ncbi:MAG: Binding-protein-dependent transport systems inner membrane component, partial [Thermotoga petrophila]
SFSRTTFIVRWDLIMAMATIMIIPPMILFLLAREYITAGIKTTGLK